MKISTIIFDWGGVFCVPAEPFSHPKLLSQLKMTPAETEAQVKLTQDKYYSGLISFEQFWHNVTAHFAVTDLSPDALNRAYLRSYSTYPEMFALARKLQKKYATGLLSNLTKEMMDHIIASHRIGRYFKTMLFSNQVGLLKPDARIYRHALKQLNATPGTTVFIDDSQKNVEAAKKLGIHAILFTSPEQCKEALAKLGVVI